MLEPGYNLQAEKLMGKIKILDEALKELDIQIDPLVTSDCEFEAASTTIKINPMSSF